VFCFFDLTTLGGGCCERDGNGILCLTLILASKDTSEQPGAFGKGTSQSIRPKTISFNNDHFWFMENICVLHL